MSKSLSGIWIRAALWVGIAAAVASGATGAAEQVIALTAKKFEFSRSEITVKKGVPVVLELTALDRVHGFSLPDFRQRVDLIPGQTVRLRFTPDRAGRFTFFCDVFCGDGHEEMTGTLVVTE